MRRDDAKATLDEAFPESLELGVSVAFRTRRIAVLDEFGISRLPRVEVGRSVDIVERVFLFGFLQM